jgi:hypothetical protein
VKEIETKNKNQKFFFANFKKKKKKTEGSLIFKFLENQKLRLLKQISLLLDSLKRM